MEKKLTILNIIGIFSIVFILVFALGISFGILRIDTMINPNLPNQEIYYHNDFGFLSSNTGINCSFNVGNSINNSFGGKQSDRIYVNYGDIKSKTFPYPEMIEVNIINSGSGYIIESNLFSGINKNYKKVMNGIDIYEFSIPSDASSLSDLVYLSVSQEKFDGRFQAILSVVYNIRKYNKFGSNTIMGFCTKELSGS